MIAIINYKMGNLGSVKNALDSLNIESVITDDVNVIKACDKLILPGVGAFKEAMQNLKSLNLIDCIKEEVKKGKPILGICLGMQLLFSSSEEYGLTEGLNLLEGKIIHFKENGLKIPHMGWNNLTIPSNSKIFKGLTNPYVYFVHSYHLVTDNKDYLLTKTTYGYEFSCAVEYKNIYATQFHPEKSGDVGLKILKNFGDL
ncbi:MAG: imidazole glycerol phosphate synthase subunit HisH [Acholeplasmatales bacterium]|nr:imidazole glycerol phosphate synthase subunit HisH [Acholeplasmatales bacterium]